MLGLLGYGEVPISVASYGKVDDLIGLTAQSDLGTIIKFSIRKVGLVTSALHSLKPGDIVYTRGPYGNGYEMSSFKGKHIMIIGGGCGAAPMMSVIDYVKHNRKMFGEVHVFFGFRSYDDILYKDCYDKLADYDISVHVSLDKPDPRWGGFVGFVTSLVEHNLKQSIIKKIENSNSDKATNNNIIAILCGPPIMIKYAIKILTQYNIPIDNIWLSLERVMYCGTGKCGHCRIGKYYVCKDGPVFNAKQIFDQI